MKNRLQDVSEVLLRLPGWLEHTLLVGHFHNPVCVLDVDLKKTRVSIT